MCGIVGLIANTNADLTALETLKKLEYRGYDSFGWTNEKLEPKKYVGAISKVQYIEACESDSKTTIAHTRWATHGKVSIENTHPHLSIDKQFAVVHNGVISNYKQLKEELIDAGYEFKSETDTEVIVNYLHFLNFIFWQSSFEDCIFRLMKELEGEYAVCIITANAQNKVYAFRSGSPLIVAKSDDYALFTSDSLALPDSIETYNVIHENELAIIENTKGHFSISFKSENGIPSEHSRVKPVIRNKDSGQDQTHSFSTYMEKEMSEIPAVIQQANKLSLPEINKDTVIVTGCGSAYYAAMIGSYFRRNIDTECLALPISADEIENLVPLNSGINLICISQSGETYDTIVPAKIVNSQKGKVISITNREDSTLSTFSDYTVFQKAGIEKCVLSTKSIISQCSILYKMFNGSFDLADFSELYTHTFNESFKLKIENLAKSVKSKDHFFHIGRGIYYPVALENALKLKEVTYCHAEGMAAGFFKHGTLSLIDDRFVTFAHLPPKSQKELYDLTHANIKEIEARNGYVVTIGHDESCDFQLPAIDDILGSLLHLGFGQYFAFYLAKELNRNIDQPRSLAKSVTVR